MLNVMFRGETKKIVSIVVLLFLACGNGQYDA